MKLNGREKKKSKKGRKGLLRRCLVLQLFGFMSFTSNYCRTVMLVMVGTTMLLWNNQSVSIGLPVDGPQMRRRNPMRGVDQEEGAVALDLHNLLIFPLPQGTSDQGHIASPILIPGVSRNERLRSRKTSQSPQSRKRSISSERKDRSPPRRSISPRRRRSPRRYSSPPRRRYPNSRRRSLSPSRYRSPSPRRQRIQSPLRRRYRSPIDRRSRSPLRHRSSSPSQSISRSPVRRRSPTFRRRSRTPVRHRSPIYFRRRSPPVPRHQYRRSPSPHRRSPSPLRRRSPTFRRRSVSPFRRRSLSPQDLSSPSAAHHSSPSPPVRRSPEGKGRSAARSPDLRRRGRDKYSPAHKSSPSEDADRPIKSRRRSDSSDHHLNSTESLRLSRRDSFDRNGSRRKLSPLPPPPPPPRSPLGSESPPVERENHTEERSKGSYEHSNSTTKKKVIHESLNPPRGLGQQKVYHDDSDSSMDGAPTQQRRDTQDKNRLSRDNLKGSSDKVLREDKSPENITDDHTAKIHNHSTGAGPRKKTELLKSERPGRLDRFDSDHKELPRTHRITSSSKKEVNDKEGDKTDKTVKPLLIDVMGQRQKPEVLPKLALKGHRDDQSGPVDSRSDESDKERIKGKDKRKRKKSEREEVASDDDSSSDSYVDDRKDSKRRRKEEKKLKKEERRRRREERRRRKEERRAEKRRRKLTDATAPPSDSEGNLNSHSSDGEHIRNRKRSSGIEHNEADPKDLEIALREKALESLRAKKGLGR
ncbi:hypothetical protein Leryth_014498 [Lithospermum erythrorhizon]|nr:hypothetical protein Leryth_014498 [Lithospermum erythrorhizon]